jgi:hypothetical protein
MPVIPMGGEAGERGRAVRRSMSDDDKETRPPDQDADETPPAGQDEQRVGQILGRSAENPPEVTRAAPGSPETGAVRDEQGRPSAEGPHIDS